MPCRGKGKHRAARTIEVAGEQVEHVHQPRGDGPELLGAGADPRVHRGRFGRTQLTSQPDDRLGIDAAHRGDRLGREVACKLAHLVDASRELGQSTRFRQAFGEQHVHHREQQEGVRSRTEEHMLIGDLGGPRTPRIDHHQPATAVAQRTQPAPYVRCRHQASVRGERIGTEHQQVIGSIQIGYRYRQAVAEHQRAGRLLRKLVQRRGRVDVAAADSLEQHLQIQRGRHIVHVRVAEIYADRVAVGGQDRCQPLVDHRERLIPGGAGEAAVRLLDHRSAQPVRILM